MATLCLLNEEGAIAAQWALNDHPVTIGRGAVEVKIDDEGLSRRHFMIFRDGESYFLRDLNSRNGTWVDGERAIVTRVSHDSRILAGRTEFRFSEDESSPEPAHKQMTGPHDTVLLPVAG